MKNNREQCIPTVGIKYNSFKFDTKVLKYDFFYSTENIYWTFFKKVFGSIFPLIFALKIYTEVTNKYRQQNGIGMFKGIWAIFSDENFITVPPKETQYTSNVVILNILNGLLNHFNVNKNVKYFLIH